MCEMLSPIHELMARFLCISGQAWRKKQLALAATGKPRSWPILEAAKGEDVASCMELLLLILLQPISGCKQADVLCAHRCQRFVMASAGMCSLHSYLRLPRQQLPYKLFKLLSNPTDDMVEALLQQPACVQDELSHVLIERYGTELNEPESMAVLQTLADIITVDVADIESAHSSTREFSQLRSRGWTSSLETISSRFVLQQRQHALGRMAEGLMLGEKQARKQKKPRRGGGGAWRAFVHAYLKGRRLTAALSAEMSGVYRALSEDERSVFQAAGRGATQAHRMGLQSFPAASSERRAAEDTLPGVQMPNGAIVLADVERELSVFAEFAGETLAEKYAVFKQELAKTLKSRPEVLAPTADELAALARHEAEAPPFMPAQCWERDGHSNLATPVKTYPTTTVSSTAAYSWCPPAEQLVQDHRVGLFKPRSLG